jgi:hypothetical protein
MPVTFFLIYITLNLLHEDYGYIITLQAWSNLTSHCLHKMPFSQVRRFSVV